jgi:hypothetical protein
LVVAVVLLGAVAVIVLWPEPEPEPAPRAREYRDYDVCVLTSDQGLADPSAAAVWAGAQEVSAQRRVRVLYVPVAGEQTPERAKEFLGSLVQQSCEVIVVVGDAPVAAAHGAKFPDTTIVAVGDQIDASTNPGITRSTVEVLLNLVPKE